MEEKKGFFKRLVEGLSKTRDSIVSGIDSIFSGFSSIDDDFYEIITDSQQFPYNLNIGGSDYQVTADINNGEVIALDTFHGEDLKICMEIFRR